jgi:iron complex outermembrane recepter protein
MRVPRVMACARPAGLVGALLVGLVAGAAGQDEGAVVRGRVLDVEGRPVAHVTVVLLPGQRQAVTDAAGGYELRRLAPGEYRVQAELMGYAPAARSLSVGQGGAVTVDLVLRPTPLTLTGIEVTSSAAAREPGAVAQATTQLSGRALQRELGGTIAHTLRHQPGVAVRLNGPGAALPVLRGLTGDRVLVLQDGQRAADLAGSADDHGMTIDALAAQRVEVVRGPATLLYGNNALGGVVNVISGDVAGGVPLGPQVSVSAQTETAYPGYALNARGLAPLTSSWSATVRGGVRRAGDMRIAADPELGSRLRNTDRRSWNAAAGVTRVAPSWSVAAAARAYDFAYGLPAAPGADPVDLRGGRSELVARSELALPWRALRELRIDGTAQRYAHDEIDDAGAVAQHFALSTGTLNARARRAPAGTVTGGAWGVSLLARDYTATGPAALTPAARTRAVGVFGFEELAVAGFDLQLGARWDRYAVASRSSAKFGAGTERSFDALSGSAGVRVPLRPGISAGVTLARSFRAPTVEELFSGAAHAGTGAVEYGNVALRAERGRSVEGLVHVRRDRTSAQLAVFRNHIDDYIRLNFVGDTVIGGVTLPVLVYAQSPATLAGVEGSVELALTGELLAAVRGDWLHAAEHDGTPLSYMPPPRAGLTLRWDDGRHSLGADAHHERAQRRTGAAGESEVDAYTIFRVDAGIRRTIARRPHSLSLRIENLTDVAHREATSRIREFAPAPGRNIALLYTAHF